ncbi:MAG: family PLP-dependent enzyme [Sediminibacterium sp.]|nr:family PLP-dependent enzyme [Sediminibacterium sp.]
MSNWYTINNIEKIDSPSLIVYPERVKENIRQLIHMAGNVDLLRPHVKTNKIAEVCQLMLDAGITKFKCATISEAEMLGSIQTPDVLIAHQPVGPKMERVLQLVTTFRSTHFTCIIDNFSTAQALSQLFTKHGERLQLFIDLNIGMDRSGIIPEKALQLFKDCQSLESVRIIGLHAYDGHIRDTDLTERCRRSDEAFAKVEWLLKEISSLVNTPFQVVVGGSPSFPTHTKRKGVQYSPGTFVFWDWGYKHMVPDEPFEYAALVITRIISIIDEQTICVDLGHKSVAAENPLPRVHFLNAPDAVPIGQSEEHLVMTLPDTSEWHVGDVLYGVPVHICPTVALYDNAVVVENKEVIDSWKVIARARKITI